MFDVVPANRLTFASAGLALLVCTGVAPSARICRGTERGNHPDLYAGQHQRLDTGSADRR